MHLSSESLSLFLITFRIKAILLTVVRRESLLRNKPQVVIFSSYRLPLGQRVLLPCYVLHHKVNL